ncbi:MAG TPA: hypothetical protein VJY34_02840, partial [Roseiarcus sp.]|nr:hypothetical protein [Roseiarcus sp.]
MDGQEIQVALDKLNKGDVVVVRTGEVVPVDGVIVEGLAMIDQHALTGESTPAEKLRHAHISELPTIGEHAKVLQTVTEGDWPWRSGRWVAVPAAELCDDP